jgi:hypothetical protein
MYDGEVFLKVEQVDEFMRVAEKLGVRGLLHQALVDPAAVPDSQHAMMSDSEVVAVLENAPRAPKRPNDLNPILESVLTGRASRGSSSVSLVHSAAVSPMPSVGVSKHPPPKSSSFYYEGNFAVAKRFRSSLPDDQPEVVVSENIHEGGGEEDVSKSNLCPLFSTFCLVWFLFQTFFSS